MRPRIVASVVLVVMALALGPGPAGAQDADESRVGVISGPVTEGRFSPECNDVVVGFDEATSFVLQRTGDTDDELTVDYQLSGSAVAGEHYRALPGTVDFTAGASSATVAVEVLSGDSTDMVELTLSVLDGEGYQADEPASATIRFVRPRDPSSPPPECGFSFAGGDPIERRVEVGATPERLVVEQLTPPIVTEVPPEGYRMRVTRGALPPGLNLGEDGRFAGTATEEGTFESEVEACRTGPPGTCTTATLVITVAVPSSLTSTTSTTANSTTTAPAGPDDAGPSTRSTLPETGAAATSSTGLGLLLIGAGAGLVDLATLARRRSPRAGSIRQQ